MTMSQDGGGHVQHGNDTAYNIINVGQTSLATDTGTLIVNASGNRSKIQIINTSTNTSVFLGNATAVTAGDGFPLAGGQVTPLWPYAGPLYGISDSGGAVTVGFVEFQS